MPKHFANVYQRPVQGHDFLGRYEAFNYKHKISMAGGYDTASFELAVYAVDADFWFDRLGCEIKIYIDNPARPAWEGYINRVNWAIGALTYTSSLDELSNRVSVAYSAPSVASTPRRTTAVNNTASQAIYGVKEGAIDGYLIEGTDVTKMDALQAMVLATQAYPQKSTIFNPQGQGAGLLSVECYGWYHALDWVKYTKTTASAIDADQIMTDILSTYPNDEFFEVTNGQVSVNPSFAQNPNSRINQTYWEMFQSIQEAGDGSSRWVMGITPSDFNTGLRYFYYRQSNNTVRYILRASEGRVRDIYGQLVDPWIVRPDCVCRVADYAIAWNKVVGDDPTTFYVDTCDYDANSQSVQFGSTDNLTAEGSFNLRRYFQTTGRRFGAKNRRNWS